jgi:DNA-binding beta-propeller fold protein YncE
VLSRHKLLVAAAVVVAGLLVAGRWLQPRLDAAPGAAPSTARPSVTTAPSAIRVPVPTAPTSTARPLPGLTRIATLPALVDDVAVTRHAVWVASGGEVVRVDPVTRRTAVVAGIDPDEPPVVGLTAGAGAVWAETTGNRLLRIDPRTARLAASLPVPAVRVAIDHSGVWALCCGAGEPALVRRIDPASNRVAATVRLPGDADAVGVGAAGLWVRSPAGLVWRLDPAGGRVVATIRFRRGAGSGEPGGAVAVTRDGVWVSDPAGGTVWRIDPRGNQLDGGWETDGSDLAVAADGVVWTSSGISLLGLGGSEVVGPRRTLVELGADLITAMVAGPDGLWLGAHDGLFHVDRRALHAA